MSVTKVLLDILVVLLAAKLAAELAERAKLPAVVGEIVAGIIIGPSALGLVQGDEVLRVLGELGVILLLLEVGMEMDLTELGAVGRASLSVATIGVVVPFALGFGVGRALGMSGNEALFVGAALTATSVGITARVFGDLRALATVEARTVLGAAVADDVMGLVILTVVVRLVTQGSVSLWTVTSVVSVGILFLVGTLVVGVRLAPTVFSFVARASRSSGTLVAIAIAFTLGFAELANAAKLAPIVGAFVAGVSLGRSPASDRIRREITPIGHLLVPVFFLQVGIDADISQFADARVLKIAGALLVVAVVGKLVSAAGLLGAPGDRALVGIGMLPRGEVGLIFATIGLREHVFGEDVYAALLLVVLVTTLLTPPILKWRLLKVRSRHATSRPAEARPAGGWLEVEGAGSSRQVELAAEPPLGAALIIALEAAVLCDHARPGQNLLQRLSELPDGPLVWTREARAAFVRLLREGGPRSWRFLTLTGVLDRALPELGEALANRPTDPFELDPTGALVWPRLSALREIGRLESLEHPERLLLAAVVLDATDGDTAAVPLARRIAHRLELGAADEQAIAGLVADAALFSSAARRADSLDEERVLQLAVHLGVPEQARALYLLTLAADDLESWDRVRLDQLLALVQAALTRPDLTGRGARNAVEQRRAMASRLAPNAAVRERIDAAPRAYVLATPAERLVRHATLCEPPPSGREVRAVADAVEPFEWQIDFVARDRTGLLARETLVLAKCGYDIVDATAVTWGDRCALASFRVHGEREPDLRSIESMLLAALSEPLSSPPVTDVTVDFDNEASPWHTLCRVEGPDRPGLLQAVTTALAVAGASVHAARISTDNRAVADLFQLSDGSGEKLNDAKRVAIRYAVREGVRPKRRLFRRRNGSNGANMAVLSGFGQENAIDAKPPGDAVETADPYSQP